jgi:hypothetical protein
MFFHTGCTDGAAMRSQRRTTMTRPRTKTIPGFQIQPMLPITFYLGGTVVEADFTEYDGKPCVEALVQIGLIKNPYTFVLSLDQAREADIIERA